MDDDPRILRATTRLLEEAGYEVHAVGRSERAARAAERLRPALAILDVSMPGKDGFDLARQLRSRAATRRTRLMFLTARQTGAHIQEAQEAGAMAYLEKPFRPEALLQMVAQVLGM